MSLRRLRHRSLPAPSRGIRIPDHALVPGQAADAGFIRPFTAVTEFSAASHATAFALWSFPGFLPGSDDPRVHISRPDTMAIPRRTGVVGHVGQFFDDEITSLDGLLITTRTRTWLDVSHSEPAQIVRDIAREEDFARAGWHLVRISRLHMANDARSAVAKVRAVLLDRGWTPN
ncbi:hypothetical protein GCM10023346_17880 [Arthrobacter gyeryongensis]|uniref:Uncharacterized protein n=1 Tax=Arthrobacter gyeryongensis TaxID=1650592 RepID=A0ABP9SBR6_9MICC